MSRYRLAKRRLAVIDVHTGLGPYGYGEVICDHPPGGAGARTAQRWYGPACTLPAEGTSSSVPKLGLLDYAWHAIMDDHSGFVTLEFGTLGTDNLFDVLLAETRAERRGHPPTRCAIPWRQVCAPTSVPPTTCGGKQCCSAPAR